MKISKLLSVKTLQQLVTKRNYNTSPPLCSDNFLANSPNAQLNRLVFDRYMALPLPECKIQACYVWIDGSGINMRCKSRTLDYIPTCASDLPQWAYDGRSMGQGIASRSDCYLKPVALYKDPMLGGNDKLVLCETYDSDNKPTVGNHRQKCLEAVEQACDKEAWFGFEQEFIFIGADRRPFGWPTNGEPRYDMLSYCGVGANNVIARSILEAFYRCCLYSGIDIYGTNAEVMPSQWEFQTGPTLNIKAGDDLWMARFILHKVAEDFGVSISFDPKLYPHLSGSGMHVNFSSKQMREDGGYEHIEEAIKRLEKHHKEHIAVYDLTGGEENKKRLTGENETAHIDTFSSGVMNRSASARISLLVYENKKGFLEDRRPASNADPYQIINVLIRNVLL